VPVRQRQQFVVDVEAAGINYLDVYHRKGIYKLPVPFSPGLQGVGRVREVGEGVDAAGTLAVGGRVAWIDAPGRTRARWWCRPPGRSRCPTRSLPPRRCSSRRSRRSTSPTEYRNLRPGDRVLVHSAAGGVGLLLVQWFKRLGAWVVGTTSSDAKAPAHALRERTRPSTTAETTRSSEQLSGPGARLLGHRLDPYEGAAPAPQARLRYSHRTAGSRDGSAGRCCPRRRTSR
jgi:D-arabinose 1-dehydrogenase-like Zn-dependent alcohol dehydrogenase